MTKEEALALIAAGLTHAEVADALGISLHTLKGWRRRDRPKREAPPVSVSREELLAMHEAGMSHAEIGAQLNLSRDTVRERLSRIDNEGLADASRARSLANQQREQDAFTDDEITSERWVPIVGFPGYEVSDLGRVRSWKRRGPSPEMVSEPHLLIVKTTKGYRIAHLSVDGMQRSRAVGPLVLESFGPAPTTRHTHIRHVDGNLLNDRLTNLAWKE